MKNASQKRERSYAGSAAFDLVVDGLGFAEGPRWHDGALWFSDIPRGQVCWLGDGGEVHVFGTVPGGPSGLGWLPDGTLLVVSMHDRAIYRLDGVGHSVHADLSGLTSAGLNDMVVGPDGTAYVTGFGYDADAGESRRATGAIMVRPDGSASLQHGELWRPNGCAITPDQSRFIVAETRLHRISTQKIGPDGSLGPRETFGELPAGSWADGLCLDQEGAVWIADPKGCKLFRMMKDGSIVKVHDFVNGGPVACALGGPEGKTLFVAIAPLRPMRDANRDPQGRIVKIEVAVPGVGSP